jgi:glycosyltransferase involved in cell wall biosynthesis
MSAMDICIVPSIEEPLGLVAIEAHAAGTPVVVSNTGGLVEIVRDQHNGLVVPPKDHDAIADAVFRLLGDPELRERMVANGRRSVRERFAPQVLTDQVVDVLRGVCRSAA